MLNLIDLSRKALREVGLEQTRIIRFSLARIIQDKNPNK